MDLCNLKYAVQMTVSLQTCDFTKTVSMASEKRMQDPDSHKTFPHSVRMLS